MLCICLCTGSSRAKAPLGMQCFTQLWCQRAGYSPDTTLLTMAVRRAGRDGSLSLCSCPWGCWVPSLPGNQQSPLCRGVVEGDEDMASVMASQSPHRFHFLTWHSVSFNSLQAVIHPSEASSLLWLHLVELFLKANSLSLPCPCHCRCFRHEISSLSPSKRGLSRELFYAKVPPQSNLSNPDKV